MIIKIAQLFFRFLFLVALQVLVLNHIQWSGYINPYVYAFFILMLPIETPKWLLLIIAFILGLVIDMFSDTGGMHAAATVLIAWARPGVLRLIAPRDGYEPETKLSPQVLGFRWFLTYTSMLILLHHLVLFYVEVFRFSEFFSTFFKAVLNAGITVLLIILGQYLFGRGNRHERFIG
ncbi:MAG: rod shape-determining protein MreD [Bacteroidetes bacterium]|nr:MAG: rod shape-determining protein MreD [Bacteroidota bacterium]REK04961.1 MAG: rod shape-determining protein MreD [Bacteroidota bacterium]REK36535.1 MAG: rod shape-determining protein MreD [Bacteroidota bacterium]REK50901.1 MAG: rod shape-determining protein MreD [Bacteroidota bacterium]